MQSFIIQRAPRDKVIDFPFPVRPVPGLKVYGSVDLDGAMRMAPQQWSVGALLGVAPTTRFVLAVNDKGQIGIGARLRVSQNGLALTGTVVTRAHELAIEKNQMAIGLEFKKSDVISFSFLHSFCKHIRRVHHRWNYPHMYISQKQRKN